MNKKQTLIPIVMLSVMLTACGEHVVKGDGSGGAGSDSSANSGSGGATVGSISGTGVGDSVQLAGKQYSIGYEKNAINDPANVLSNHTIYFDYDSSDIREEYIDLVKHHGKYLALHADMRVRLEGHTDERGTREYNVALADRRAQAVKRILTFQGAASDQISIVSYGEEKPAMFGHDEESWALNRRAELVYEKR